ncbi:MAG: GxxExxY protein [Candidatus Magasanikbacteria bacterium]|nr:GxxExxY protein [Candidatus Magasanikbacteria bacterium]
MEGKSQIRYVVKKKDLLFPELSFKVNGVLFGVFKQLGGGHREHIYQKSVAIGLQNAGIVCREQVYVPLKYQGKMVGKYFLDFLVEERLILELKQGQFIPAHIINQVKQYLSALDFKLALIGCFTHSGVYVKRIVNDPK